MVHVNGPFEAARAEQILLLATGVIFWMAEQQQPSLRKPFAPFACRLFLFPVLQFYRTPTWVLCCCPIYPDCLICCTLPSLRLISVIASSGDVPFAPACTEQTVLLALRYDLLAGSAATII